MKFRQFMIKLTQEEEDEIMKYIADHGMKKYEVFKRAIFEYIRKEKKDGQNN